MLHARLRAAAGNSGSSWESEVLADSPFAWWKFLETSGTTAEDEIGTNDGSVSGANLNVAGHIDSAVSFDGTDDSVSLGTLGDFGSSISLGSTFETILINDGTTDSMPYGTVTSGSPGTAIWLRANHPASGKLSFFLRGDNSGGRGITIDTNNSVLTGSYQHIAIVVESNAFGRIYVSGVEVPTTITESGSGALGNAIDLVEPMTLGCRSINGGSLSFFWPGDVDEHVLYKSALSASRILAHAAAAGLD